MPQWWSTLTMDDNIQIHPQPIWREDETWVHHPDPNTKKIFKEWKLLVLSPKNLRGKWPPPFSRLEMRSFSLTGKSITREYSSSLLTKFQSKIGETRLGKLSKWVLLLHKTMHFLKSHLSPRQNQSPSDHFSKAHGNLKRTKIYVKRDRDRCSGHLVCRLRTRICRSTVHRIDELLS